MQSKLEKLIEKFTFITETNKVDVHILEKFSIGQTVPKGKLITTEGEGCTYFSFLISGT